MLPCVLVFTQNDQMGVPLIFKVDPDGFYLSARGEKNKVCVCARARVCVCVIAYVV